MESTAIQEELARSFLDHRLSRKERQALAEALEHVGPGVESDAIRRHAFALVQNALKSHVEAAPMLEWLEDVIKHLPASSSRLTNQQPFAEAHFSPGDDCPRAISHCLGSARETMELCLFTITDDRLSNQVLGAHQRGVKVRLLTDNDKAGDLGSDIARLRDAGIPVRSDRSPYHMHHKFALFDRSILLTGSYNWTRGAARDNQENLIVTNDRGLVSAFESTFERLWQSMA